MSIFNEIKLEKKKCSAFAVKEMEKECAVVALLNKLSR